VLELYDLVSQSEIKYILDVRFSRVFSYIDLIGTTSRHLDR
jgi:hypothetical protein